MPGISGADVNAAYAASNTWAVPASVTQKVLLTTTEGLDAGPAIVDDNAFNQSFIGEGEPGDYPALTPELNQQLRYEGPAINWIAMACGSPSAPTVVSSTAANSLVAYSHVINLATQIAKWITLAVDTGLQVLEVPSLKIRGFSIRSGDAGRIEVSYPVVGCKSAYDSTTNTNSTVGGAAAAPMTNRVYRKQGVFRMNLQSAGALGASDIISNVRDLSIGLDVPLTTDDNIFGQDYIIEPDVDGFANLPVEITFARMNTVSANSLARAFGGNALFKADLTFTGSYINSTTQRSLKLEFPALQMLTWKAPVSGHNQVRPVATFAAKMASNTPTSFTFIRPLRITVINMNSATLC